jgi:hypothetical protein
MTEGEKQALTFLSTHGGSVLISQVPDKNEKDFWGAVVAGINVYKKLDKQGLVVITEEEPDEEGFTWTPMIELTDAGKAAVKTIKNA